MRIVQTALSDSEYRILEEYARQNSTTIRQALRIAIRRFAKAWVDSEEPIFKGPPAARRPGTKEDASVRHDTYIYGGAS